MKYKELKSKGFNWLLNHSILQDNGDILSFEEGEFKLYNTSYLNNRETLKEYNVPKIDLKAYEGVHIEDKNCFEAIEYIYANEWLKMTTWNLWKRIKIISALAIVFCIWFVVWFIVSIWVEATLVKINNIINYE